ncbi:non-ribosomal peptide synthetase, partial [Pseudoalteromonas denitrificans]
MKNYILSLLKKGVTLSLADNKLQVKGNLKSLEAADKTFLKQNKIAVIEFIKDRKNVENLSNNQITSVSHLNNKSELSFAQQRLWFIDKLQSGSPEYNIPVAFKVEGKLDTQLVESVISEIIQRHEILRTVYIKGDNAGLQHIKSNFNFSLSHHDLTGLTDEARKVTLKSLIDSDVQTPFNLQSDLMIRVSYILLTNENEKLEQIQQGVLLFNMHHIASDGWSMEVLSKEFFTLYQAFATGIENPLPVLEIQYADYAQWQNKLFKGEAQKAQIRYWEKQLAELPLLHSIPLDNPRSETKNDEGGMISTQLPKEIAVNLLTLAKQYHLTPFMLLHSALALVLSRHSNSCDIVIGTPVANRMQAELKPLIGFFVNTLVLRLDTQHLYLDDYLAHVRQVHLDAQSNQEVPFEKLVERLNIPRTSAHNPLFQIMLTTNTDYGLNNLQESESFNLPGISLSPLQSESVTAAFDLNIDMKISDEGLITRWIYDVNLFKEQHIKQLNDHLCRLLEGLSKMQKSSRPFLDDLSMLSEKEVDYLVHKLNDRTIDYPKDKCIHELFEQQAKDKPNDIAVVFEDKQLTYKELNEKSNQLAHYLRENHHITPDTLVGLCVERSLEMVIGILGILKSGGAYVPLDPSYPQERINYMLKDASLNVVISQTQVQDVLVDFNGFILALDGLDAVKADNVTYSYTQFSAENLALSQIETTVSSLAYVIYTSGSTGQPKGVMVEHRNTVSMLYWALDTYSKEELNVVLASTSLNFDLSIYELFLPLSAGTKLRIVKNILDVATGNFVSDITLLNTVPSAMDALLKMKAVPSNVKVINLAGEALRGALVNGILASYPDVVVCNLYGPSEDTTYSTYARYEDIVETPPHIGKVISNSQGLILDDNQKLVPLGSSGELYLGGDGLTRGYLNRSELTEERFIENPFYDEVIPNSSKYLYCTGDLVRYLPEGDLEFIGRADNQVKIRGFRIELGELEAQLSQLELVDSALVITKELAGSQQLVGYIKPVTSFGEKELTSYVAQTKVSLEQQLPEYMIPNILMVVSEWPLTPNGKIDRNALPAPDGSALQSEYIAPSTEIELILADIWAQLLNINVGSIGITANFFHLGGHSLLTIRLISEISKRFEVEVSIMNIFENAQLKALANIIKQSSDHLARPPIIAQVRNSDKAQVSFAQQRLWFIDSLQGGSSEYNMPIAFNVSGELNITLVTKVFNTIIERHEVLRTLYKEKSGETLQYIRNMSDVDFDITVEDLTHLTGETLISAVKNIVESNITAVFDLSTDLMLRVSYVKKTADAGVLIFNIHHIASDGWSMEILTKEFIALYHAYSEGLQSPLPELDIQYVDYAHWQREFLEGEVLESQLSFWEKQLDELPAIHSLPLCKIRPQVKKNTGAIITGQLPAIISKQLDVLTKEHEITPFMLLHGALSLLLSRHSNRSDIVIGTPMANRLKPELESLIGFFVNTLVLRVDTKKETLSDYFTHIRQVHLDAQSNQDVPFEQLVERLKTPRSTAHTPLFQIMMTTTTDYGVNDNHNIASLQLPGVGIQPYQSDFIQAKFDLNIDLSISEQGVGLNWTYDTHLFSEQYISQLNTHLCCLLEGLSQMKGQSVLHRLPMLSQGEENYLLNTLNETQEDHPKNKCIHELFEQQAKNTPNATAVVFKDKKLTYKELNEKANQLAHYLVAHHQVKADTLIGLCITRSIEMMIGMLGILKAGGAYVPMDPDYPKARLDYMLEDAGLNVVLTLSHVQKEVSFGNAHALCLDGLGQKAPHIQSVFDDFAIDNLETRELGLNSSHLAYVIYTSGSTGNPKGVLTPHIAVSRLVINPNFMPLDQDTVFLQSANIAFDAATLEIWGGLLNGGKCILYPERYLDINRLNEIIVSEQVNALWLTAGLFSEWSRVSDKATTLKWVLAGGDVLNPDAVMRVQKMLPQVTLINGYGPTENTTFTCCYQIPKVLEGDSPIAIGRPLSGDQVVIMSDEGNLLPMGATGELCVGGDGLARGYLNSPELTAERFIDNPYYDESKPNSSRRLYKTGDLVRYLKDSNIEFIGRIDAQIKIRGFRVELGEIEYQINQDERVDSALVVAKETSSGGKQLIGYVKLSLMHETADVEKAVLAQLAEIKGSLLTRMPDYMVPSAFVKIEEWPLTANGKVDRKSLPQADDSLLQGEYVGPQTDTEKALVNIWSGLLNLEADKISTTANFFELG